MSSQFALDLRLARKKAGYTQLDVAHLLATHQTIVSEFEQGTRSPNLTEIVTLSLIYHRPFESYFEEVMARCREHLTVRLANLPPPGRRMGRSFNRPASLARLKRRLDQESPHDGA